MRWDTTYALSIAAKQGRKTRFKELLELLSRFLDERLPPAY